MNKLKGIRARLLIAFFGISSFAVLAAAAALFSFYEVGRVLDRISRSHTPEAILSLELSRQAERLVSASAEMLSVSTNLQREQIHTRTTNEGERLNVLIAQLREVSDEDSLLDTIDWSVKNLIENLNNIDKLVDNRLRLDNKRQELLAINLQSIESLGHLRAETMDQLEGDGIGRQTLAPPTPLGSKDDTSVVRAVSSDLKLLNIFRRADEHINSLHDIVLTTGSGVDQQRLSELAIQAEIAIDALEASTKGLDAAIASAVNREIEQLRIASYGNGGLFSLMAQRHQAVADARDVMIENSWLTGELSGAVDDLVSRAKANITAAISDANASQEISTLFVMIVVALSLICSIAIVWLYVGRSIISRLTELSTAMESVAGGDLRIELPGGGNDEIGRMVEALTVFRDTAIEIEENNLREIGQARQRLVDAIESISEGFCYFDAEDKLVVANNSYREMVRYRGGQTVKEGMSFEDLARIAAESGYVEDANGRVDEWIAERIEQHKNPGPPHIQRRGDDLWMMISERRTADGGTVAVYSDITELKQREEQLADKSKSMEQLSNQIAKYLSPQVYESIFTGKKEVKVASHRRKLTVFFSDIAGFTETADQMESEDLTQILNQYLTEMTQIALAHGATVDKYVGDAIVIFFGDPETRGIREDALACVNMAIAMRERMTELQETWRDSGVLRPLQCRIGINTGFCTVGNFGSEERMDYTIIGSGVNLASRLEGSATPGEILVSYETYALVRDTIKCESKGELKVRGLAYPVETFEVIDSYEKLGSRKDMIRETHPNFNLTVNVDALSNYERDLAVDILGQALARLETLMPEKKASAHRR